MIEAVAAMMTFFFVLQSGGWTYGQPLLPSDFLYLQATTGCLSAIMVMQIVNVFLCRSATRSVCSTGLFGNQLIVWGVVLEITLMLIIDYTPWGHVILGTAPLARRVWLCLGLFAAGMLLLEEARKEFVRKLN
jgi:sodium/potassium-transporting ATPase subunit alpha